MFQRFFLFFIFLKFGLFKCGLWLHIAKIFILLSFKVLVMCMQVMVASCFSHSFMKNLHKT
jgi:hypothetical protein